MLLLNMSFGKNQPLKRILLDQGHWHIVCRPTEVCYLNSEADNTRVFLADGTWGSIDDSLIEMESVLPKDLFFRANRQNLINVDYVHSIAQGSGRDFIVNLKEPYSSIEFILTPEKKKELIEMLMYGSSSYQPEWEESDTRFTKRFGYYRRFHRLHDQYFGRKTYGIDNVVYIEEVIKCDNRVLHHLISIKPIASRSALVKSYKSNSILSIAIAFSFEY